MNLRWIVFSLLIWGICFPLGAVSKKTTGSVPSLKTSRGTLEWNKKGICFTSVYGLVSQGSEGAVWSVRLQNRQDREEIGISSTGQQFSVKQGDNSFQVVYKSLKKDGKVWPVEVELNFRAQEEAFVIDGQVRNAAESWTVVGFTGPVLNGIQAELPAYRLLMPCGLGQEFVKAPTEAEPVDKVSFKGGLAWKYNAAADRYELSAHYPSRFATMQWYTLSGERDGLYIGSHDYLHGSKRMSVRYSPEDHTLAFTFSHDLACAAGEAWTLPAMVVRPYAGSWHQAARFYREWFDASVPLVESPEWVKNTGGWMLTILKQQNDEVMWDYASLKEMCDIAAERGLDVIGLYGWAHGGHDRFYPDYHPDTVMGGKEALVQALADIRGRGMHAVIYVNGQLIDQNGTDYWGEQGKYITVTLKDSSLDYQKWHKYHDAPARYHGMACLGCEAWYERMLELAIQANALGADGIIYDQLAVTAPKFCYAAHHGHAVPAVVYTGDRYRLLERISRYMKTVNPEFIIMTEGLCDAVLGSVSWFHGYENGAYVPLQQELEGRFRKIAPTSIFPELFKYTFPELLTTTRNPAPVNNRLILNYATVYGLRQELESRYAADVRYLKENRIPVAEDYANVRSKPNLDLVTREDPLASKVYTRQVIDFQRQNSNLLWEGHFKDTEGFTLTAPVEVMAKSFVNGDRMGVVVWNMGSSQAVFQVKAPGYVLEDATEPGHGHVEAGAELAGESIRLLIFKKLKE